MGYYTNFQLDFNPNVHDEDQFLGDLKEFTGYSWSNDYELYDVKWYNWMNDMTELSKKYPNHLFQLDGQGEESGDIWRAFFKGGKSQVSKARIVFDKFNEAALK